MDDVARDEAHFDHLVSEALDALPDDIAGLMTNVAVTVEDEPPPGQPLLGLYEGIPWGNRGPYYGGALPDKITIYRGPVERIAGGDSEKLTCARAARRLSRDRAPFRDQRRAARRDRPLLKSATLEDPPDTESWFSAWRMRCSSCQLVRGRLAGLDLRELGLRVLELLLRPRVVDLARRDGVVDERDRPVLEHLEETGAGRELAAPRRRRDGRASSRP